MICLTDFIGYLSKPMLLFRRTELQCWTKYVYIALTEQQQLIMQLNQQKKFYFDIDEWE